MRTALVTGANKGLGLATARLLAREGIRVWLGSRSLQAGEIEAERLRQGGADVSAIQLDVTNATSVAEAKGRIQAGGGLDILINNAAIMDEGSRKGAPANPPSAVSIDALERTFRTNLFGAIGLTQALLPVLMSSVAPRIVNVSSRLGSFGHQTDADWPGRSVNKLGYSSSKAALNMATLMLAYELRWTRAKINAVTPGIIATDLNGEGSAALSGRPGFAPAEKGAEIVLRCALLPDDGPSGRFFGPDGELLW